MIDAFEFHSFYHYEYPSHSFITFMFYVTLQSFSFSLSTTTSYTFFELPPNYLLVTYNRLLNQTSTNGPCTQALVYINPSACGKRFFISCARALLSPVRFLPRHSLFADCKLYIRTRLLASAFSNFWKNTLTVLTLCDNVG